MNHNYKPVVYRQNRALLYRYLSRLFEYDWQTLKIKSILENLGFVKFKAENKANNINNLYPKI